MGLFVEKDAVVEIAEEDIEVYKVVCKSNETFRNHYRKYYASKFPDVVLTDNTLISTMLYPYHVGGRVVRDVSEIINETNNQHPRWNVVFENMTDSLLEYGWTDKIWWVVEGIHTFSNIESARDYQTNLDNKSRDQDGIRVDTVIIKGIIPKGSPMYKGSYVLNSRFVDGYVSSSLDIISITE